MAPPLQALLIDLDGVLYVEDEPLAGAAGAVDELRGAGLALRFVTNTTSHSRGATLAKLRTLGLEVADAELVTPASIAVRHCIAGGHRAVALLVDDAVKADFADLPEDPENPDAVIVGDLGERFGYAVLNVAFRQLMNGAELVALQKNRYWQRRDGLALDVGPFVAALEYATGREAYVCGKPASDFFDAVLAGLPAPRSAIGIVGDDVETDIGGGLAAGIRGILVRTGKYRPDGVRSSGIEPTATIDSIADLPALLRPLS